MGVTRCASRSWPLAIVLAVVLLSAVSTATAGLSRVCPTGTGSGEADDPAFWTDPANPQDSLVLVTYKHEKTGELRVFRVRDCSLVRTLRGIGYPNNVDVEYGFDLAGQRVDIAVLTERVNNQLRVYRIPDFTELGRITTALPLPMGVTLYKDPATGVIEAFVSPKNALNNGTGSIQRYRLNGSSGSVTATLVQRFGDFSSEVEALSVDDERGILYASHERGAVRGYSIDGALIRSFGQTGFSRDREGSAIYTCGSERYVIVSNQGSSNFRVYDINNEYAFVGDFAAEGTTSTDGIEVTTVTSIANFPTGVFAAQNSDRNVNLYRLGDVATTLGICSADTLPLAPPPR